MKPPTNQERTAISRRDFLKSFAPIKGTTKKPALSGQCPAPQRFALDALKDLPDSVLRHMVPILRRGLALTIREDAVAFRGENKEQGLAALRREACAAARLFDGLRTLEQVGLALDIEHPGQPGSGFLLAREAFLALSARGVFHPAGPPMDASKVQAAMPAARALEKSEPGRGSP